MTTATFLRTPSALAEPKGAAHVRGSPDKTTLVLFTIEGARNPSHTYEATFDYQAVVTPGGYGAPILVDNATVRGDAIVGEMTNTTQETFSQLTATSMCFDADGRWGTVSEAAQVFGVSVDTIRRRMKRGELDTRREQTPQGFRWLIHLPDDADEESPQDAPRAPPAGDPHAQGSVVVYGPDPRDALIETLQRELDLWTCGIVRWHGCTRWSADKLWRSRLLLQPSLQKRRSRMPQNRWKGPPQVSGLVEAPASHLRRWGFWDWLLGR